ncbi:MAG: LytR/AlgR family response regulator transcription factor [Longibaculum sp.]
MKLAIIDDEKEFCDILSNMLYKMGLDNIEIYTYVSVFDMEKSHINFELLLLDIDMPDMDGIVYAKEHRKQNIVFITNCFHRVKDAFGTNVYGFIEKDNELEKNLKILHNIINEILNEKYITLKIDMKYESYILKEIVYFMYVGYKSISFVYNNQFYTIKGYTLKEIERMLDEQFIYIDRSTLVNKRMIYQIIGNRLYVRNIQQPFIVSVRRKKYIREIIEKRRDNNG